MNKSNKTELIILSAGIAFTAILLIALHFAG